MVCLPRAMKSLSVVIPVYNERETVDQLLDRVRAAPIPSGMELEMVVVGRCFQRRNDRPAARTLETARQGVSFLRTDAESRQRRSGSARLQRSDR